MANEGKVIQFPEFPGARPATSHEYAYQRLRHALMVGAIAPGISITIQELADELGISATPVREALRRLESENALLSLKNRRIQVPQMTPARLQALIALRCTIEIHAAKQALPYINLVLIGKLERIEADLDAALVTGERAAIVTLNQRFHSAIYRADPEQIVMPMVESLWLQLGPFMGLAARQQQWSSNEDHHKRMLDALRDSDETALANALEADIREGIEPLIEASFWRPQAKA